MKKLVAVLAAICIFFVGALSYKLYSDSKADEGTVAAEEDVITIGDDTAESTEESAAPTAGYQTLDREALYALYAPDTVVATVDGDEICWDEYFYWIVSNSAQVENYIASMASYGMEVKWSDPWNTDSDESYADYVIWTTDECIKESHSILNYAESNGISLTQEDEDQIAEILKTDMLNYCGEDATDEDFDAFLAEMYMPRSVYTMMNRMNLLYQRGYDVIFGENGQNVSDDDALAYLEENGYIYANHILFMTIDPDTGAALDEETVAKQLEKAEELVTNLRAHEGSNEELVARFEELKAEYCEDTGKTAYPSGYTFTPGTMVPEFEDTCNALAEYEVSDPVLTSYGYHIIIRLPLDVDAIIDFSSTGTALTARSYYANTKYGELMQEQLDKSVLSYAEGFEGIKLMDYLV